MKRNFGDILHDLMKERKISGRSLAKELGIPYKTLQEWLGPGARMPRDPEVLKKVSDYFNVSVHYLLFGEEDQRTIIGEFLDKTEIHTGLYEITVKRVNQDKRRN
jgi:transcriptional regulator with XRE-family HTH domain